MIVDMSGIRFRRNVYGLYQSCVSSYFMITSLSICLTLTLTLTSGDSPKLTSGNNTGGYTPDKQQSLRTLIVHRNGKTGQSNSNNNFTKLNARTEINSESGRVDSDPGEWSLQFDPNYFASLNAANHRPIDLMSASPSESKPKVSSSSSPASDNIFYYSPETYGKTTHKNHKTGSFTYSYPSSSTTTSTSTTPTPKASNNRYGEYSSHDTASNGYSEPALQSFSTPYNPTDTKHGKHPTMHFNYDDVSEDEEEPNYYDGNEGIGRKYYYPTRNRNKHYAQHDYYGTDMSAMPTSNDNSKVQSEVETPVADYGPNEETNEYGSNVDMNYGTTSNMKFPSKYYGGTGAYYPSYYPSPYYPQSGGHGYSGEDSLSHSKSSWLGPGIAGLLLGIGLPLGILVASMVPAFMTVPIVSTATVGRKKRQLYDADVIDFNNTQIFLSSGILQIITKYGMSSLEDSKCLQEMFCTFTAEGKNSKTNLVQNLIYKVVEWTPVQWAKSMGTDTLFNAIKNDKCLDTYQCIKRKGKS